MPKITLKIMFGPLRSLTGRDEIILEARNFKEILNELSRMYGKQVYELFFTKDGVEYPFNNIIIDGKTLKINEIMEKDFKEDKFIYIWPALDGGI